MGSGCRGASGSQGRPSCQAVACADKVSPSTIIRLIFRILSLIFAAPGRSSMAGMIRPAPVAAG
jgi:hypothetical protein